MSIPSKTTWILTNTGNLTDYKVLGTTTLTPTCYVNNTFSQITPLAIQVDYYLGNICQLN